MIKMIWEQVCDDPMHWKILPSGMVELIFRVGPTIQMEKARKLGPENNPMQNFCFLSGLHTKPLYMSFEKFHVVGVQMYPVAVKALFGLPANEIRDGAAEGDMLFDELNRVEDLLKSAAPFPYKARRLEHLLLRRIHENNELYVAMKLSRLAQGLVRQKTLGESIDIATCLGYSRTQTFRIFNDWFGWSAGHCLQLFQFVNSTHRLHLPFGRLVDVGMQEGYFDQPHFIRAFKDFAEMTPGEYRGKMTGLPGQLSY
ncbi:MAG: AraC family transcriptional regulator [Saprospiraceae bacterium]|nr:AraC family transcriptional regulator [Saprospiraceae bacterium]